MRRHWICMLAAALLLPAFSGLCVRADDGEIISDDGLWRVLDYGDGEASVILLDKTIEEAEVPDRIKGYTITNVEVDCFKDAENLRHVTLPSTLTMIDDYAFMNCVALEEIVIPPSVRNLGWECFYNCASLQEVTIPAGVEEIEEFVFEGCASLEAIHVESGNRMYKDEDGVLFNIEGTTLIRYPSAKADPVYSLPEGCERIEDFAFIGNTHMEQIEGMMQIRELGEDAFYGCTALTNIELPDGITLLNRSTFGTCESLRTVRLPADLTGIGFGAFYGCYALESIEIPESVTQIGDYAFYNCPHLSTVALGPQVTEIGTLAFGFYGDGENNEHLPGFKIDAKQGTAAFDYCAENSVACTGGVTQGIVFVYIVLGVVGVVLIATIAIIIVRRRIARRYEI